MIMSQTIKIDSNERGKLCDAVIRKANSAGLIVERQQLIVGDYLLGAACIEAKSVGDLLHSCDSGHLWKQLDNMDANYERFFLLVHGTIKSYVKLHKKPYSAVQSKLVGLIARIMSDFDCQVFFTENTSEAAQFVIKLHNKLHKPASRHGAQAIRRVTTNDVRKDVLLAIPGIGPTMAERLLKECGSIEEMLYMESLKKVKGLGDKMAKRIIAVLTSESVIHIEKSVFRRS
jgi:ERCC4-type nuclease